MTKARDPLTFEDAIVQITKALGWEAAAAVVGKGVRLLGYWSDPDDDREPSLTQALKLDAAYRAKTGGEGAPLLAAYAYRLELEGLHVPNNSALIELASKACKETGEALGALMEASRPGATPKDRESAARETDQAIDALTHARATLAPLRVVSA